PILFVFALSISAFAQEEAAVEEASTNGLAIGLLMILVGVGAVMLVGLLLNQNETNSEEE
ncbi:MAG: hypothetical protein KC496_01885, partial [Anaerolineae bacterium]|nr:hypothetical protein [Anaerolineae bacterium]